MYAASCSSPNASFAVFGSAGLLILEEINVADILSVSITGEMLLSSLVKVISNLNDFSPLNSDDSLISEQINWGALK